jgi:hypothetical protein
MKNHSVLIAAMCGFLPSVVTATVIDLDSISVGTTIPIAITSGPVTAVLSSPDGGVFSVFPSFFSSFAGNVLVDNDPASHVLNMVFSRSLDSISFQFALNGPSSPSITVRTLAGGVGGLEVGSTTAIGAILPNGLFPEGSISISGQRFDTVEIRSTAIDLGIGNIALTTAPIPEPSTLISAITGILLLGLLRVKKGRYRNV